MMALPKELEEPPHLPENRFSYCFAVLLLKMNRSNVSESTRYTCSLVIDVDGLEVSSVFQKQSF